MSELYQGLTLSDPFAIIELYELHLVTAIHGSNDILRFHNGVNAKTPSGEIRWAGQVYYPYPIEVEGFEYNGGNSQLPRPTVRVSNVLGTISTVLINSNALTPGSDLTGAKFIRIRTLSRFLDNENFPNNSNPYGTPDQSSAAEMPREIYYVDRKTVENRDIVEFELAASFDMAGVKAPKRLAMSNLCQWQYRGVECGYTGTTIFGADDQQLNTVAATNFPAGTVDLTVNQNLYQGQFLTSSNGWYRTALQTDGNVVTYAKPISPADPRWALNTLNSRAYRLNNQSDGNLVLYRSDNTVVWASNTDYLGTPTALTHRDWRNEGFINTGRAGAFFYEILGNADSYPGQSRTASYTFTVGSRTITISYTATSTELPAAYKTAFTQRLGLTVNYSWSQGTPVINNDYNDPALKPMAKGTVVTSTGLWRSNQLEYFNAEATVNTANPWKNGDPTTLTAGISPASYPRFTTVAAVYSVRTGSGYANNYLRMQDDGNLVYYNSANAVLWSSNYVNTLEPRVTATTNQISTTQDVCGKRLSSCKLRFPGASTNLPFGGFPGLGNYY